jgi:hypothetical protein
VAPHPPLYTIIEDTMADTGAEQALARDMIAVHGSEAAVVARQNARSAALAGQTDAGEILDSGARKYSGLA